MQVIKPSRCCTTRIQSSWYVLAGQQYRRKSQVGNDLRLTIQTSLPAILTTGLTPHAAIAATASCIPLSRWDGCQRLKKHARQLPERIWRAGFLPSMFPCSVSTRTQSNPHLAMVLAWLLPGSICHAPNVSPEPVLRAFWSRFAACILNLWRILTSEWNDM